MQLVTGLLLCCFMLGTAGTAVAMQVDPSAVTPAGRGHVAGIPELESYQGGGVTLSQAVEQVRRQYNGRIVSAVTQVSGNRETHVIKVLTEDGKVKTVRVPGRRLN